MSLRVSRLRGGFALLVPLLAAPLCAVPVPACAQARPGGTDAQASARAYRHVAAACRADYLRFCPSSAQLVPQPREQVVCLKAYKVDLSLGCRGAVEAVGK